MNFPLEVLKLSTTPPLNLQIIVLVQETFISCMQPTVYNCGICHFFILVIAIHYKRTSNKNLFGIFINFSSTSHWGLPTESDFSKS